MMKSVKGSRFFQCLAAGAVALSYVSLSQATPYATSLTNDGTKVSFRLNQAADKVRLLWNGGSSVLDLGARPAGLITTNTSLVGNPFQVEVTKSNAPGWLAGAVLRQGSDTTATLRFPNPRGVAVNNDPASPYFGRIYVANGLAGSLSGVTGRTTVGDGIFVINPDFSDVFGQLSGTARTAGITNFAQAGDTGGLSPFRLEVGQDNNLYIADTSLAGGNMFVTDPDVATNGTATNILVGFGSTTLAANTTNLHGRISSSVIASGSLANGDLTLYALDGDSEPNGNINRIRRWNVGAGPLPVDLPTTSQNNSALLEISGVTVDLDRGPDGKFYLLQYRSGGAEAGLIVVDPAVDNDDDYGTGTPDGLYDVVYSSLTDSILNYGQTTDLLVNAYGVKVSPDGNYLAIVRYDSRVWVIKLVNGIPDLSSRKLLETGSTSIGRDICFDRAGNLYEATSGHSAVRVFSPGYPSVATTGSDGTFNVTRTIPENTVNVAVANPTASEPNVPGTFTFTRTGSTASALTVPYKLTGTAVNGTDYVTNNLSVTFPAGVDTLNVDITPIDDNISEPTETVILTLSAPTNLTYLLGTQTTGTIQLYDDGADLPGVSVAATGLGFYELLPDRPAKFNFGILTPYGSDLTIHYTLSGTAVSGTDYVAPSGTVVLPAGQTNVSLPITPINNSVIDTNKTVIVNVASDAAYVVTTPSSATLTLRNDDLVPGASVLFTDDFDADDGSTWTVNATDATSDVAFNFDYSNAGIPPAPHSTGGSTVGLRLRAHLSGSATSGISASPTGQSFTGDYRLRFDLWMNYNGPMPGGGAGSSEYFTAGIGVSETRTNVTGGVANGNPGSSVVVAVDGDGGFVEGTGDFIVYTNNVAIAASGTAVYPAGARDNFAAYYAEFGELPAPAAQLALYPAQTGLSTIGSLMGSWHDVVVTRQGTNVTWDIDGLRIAQTPYTAAFIGSNISLGYQDINTSLTGDPEMNFALVDNLRVESLTVTPAHITAITLINGGTQVQIDFTAGAGDGPGAFTLQSSATANSGYADTAAAITSTGAGTFRAVATVSGSQQFYRLKR